MKTYYDKYLKYKHKYLTLKNIITQSGGSTFCTNSNYPYQNKNMVGGGSDKKRLILLKAEWCGHCQAFKEEWNKIKSELESDDLEIITFDSDKDKKMMEKYQVKGFPTILLENKNKIVEFKGMRNLEAVKKFLMDN